MSPLSSQILVYSAGSGTLVGDIFPLEGRKSILRSQSVVIGPVKLLMRSAGAQLVRAIDWGLKDTGKTSPIAPGKSKSYLGSIQCQAIMGPLAKCHLNQCRWRANSGTLCSLAGQ